LERLHPEGRLGAVHWIVDMKHFIDSKIDCVFKALLGTERNRRLLIHFLNAILAGERTVPCCRWCCSY
jgi:hypothetical protein